MVEQHTWSGPTHDGTHLFFHGGAVTMDGAHFARRLPASEAAMVQTVAGITEQFGAAGTELPVALFVSAVEPDHLSDRMFFFFNAIHGLFLFHRGKSIKWCGTVQPSPYINRSRFHWYASPSQRDRVNAREKDYFRRKRKNVIFAPQRM